MNKREREQLQRIVQLIDRVPFPHDGGGVSSASLRGMVTFQSDARVFFPQVRRVLNDMIFKSADTADNDIECGVDYENPDERLDELERWAQERGRVGWE